MYMEWICCKKWYVLNLTQEFQRKLLYSTHTLMILISLNSIIDRYIDLMYVYIYDRKIINTNLKMN